MLFCGAKGKLYRGFGVQAGGNPKTKEVATPCEPASGSYQRNTTSRHWTYDGLKDRVLGNRDLKMKWIMDEGLIASQRKCPTCANDMALLECRDRSDGMRWECRTRFRSKRHKCTLSIRKGSWFEESNLTLEEILKFMYWWTQGLNQDQIKKQLRINANTAVDWDVFCRETCEVTIENKSEKIGGTGKVVEKDESKVGKRKYHHGHRVGGQWIFGGVEEESRKCFLVPVEDHSEATLLPIIKKWIEHSSYRTAGNRTVIYKRMVISTRTRLFKTPIKLT